MMDANCSRQTLSKHFWMEKLEMKRYIFTTWLVARTSSSRTCPVADEEHVRNSAFSPSMASENFWMDGIAWLYGSQQRENHVYEMGRIRLHHAFTVCWWYGTCVLRNLWKMIKKFMKRILKRFWVHWRWFHDIILRFGREVEQDKGQIRLHLNTYVNEMLEEYKAYIKRDLKPKKYQCSLELC